MRDRLKITVHPPVGSSPQVEMQNAPFWARFSDVALHDFEKTTIDLLRSGNNVLIEPFRGREPFKREISSEEAAFLNALIGRKVVEV